MKKILLPISLIAIMFTMSCSKAENNKTEEQILDSKSQLTEGKWQIVSSTYQKFTNGVGGVIEDEYSLLSTCQKDNYIVYKLDESFLEDEGATKCSDTAKQQKVLGTWQLKDGDKILRVLKQNYFSGVSFIDTTDWTINELTKTTLKLTYSHNGGTTYRFETIEKYKHID
jgi:hypothetical protein